jgi:cholesterol 7alpha-monooxygenase
LKALVRGETEAAWDQLGTLDIKYLVANCPNLDSAFHESLRLNGGAMVSRSVLRKTTIGGRVLQPGNGILMPSRQLHTNEAVWGVGSARTFDASRFLQNKSLGRHSSFRPFGGGSTYCPGRVLAKEEVYGFIAILLHRFDLKLAPEKGERGVKPPFPLLDVTTPGLGITGPVKSMDVIVDMKKIT